VTALILGTRGSALARAQTELVAHALVTQFPAIELSTRVISTEADRLSDVPVTLLGDKGVWVRNIERALLSGEIDIAVHSLKDVPVDTEVAGLTLAAFPVRADPRDVLVSNDGAPLDRLPAGSRIGTSSLRRRAQILDRRPDLAVVDIRGNVDTRLRKLDEGLYDAVVLAAAGLKRLGLEERITEYLPVELFTPDAGQGTLAVQTRGRDQAETVAAQIDDPASRAAALAERAVVRSMGADCRSPVGVFASLSAGGVTIRAMAAGEGGGPIRRQTVEGRAEEAESLGSELGARLRLVLQP
jgi:hydroxymethylbilane synthase